MTKKNTEEASMEKALMKEANIEGTNAEDPFAEAANAEDTNDEDTFDEDTFAEDANAEEEKQYQTELALQMNQPSALHLQESARIQSGKNNRLFHDDLQLEITNHGENLDDIPTNNLNLITQLRYNLRSKHNQQIVAKNLTIQQVTAIIKLFRYLKLNTAHHN